MKEGNFENANINPVELEIERAKSEALFLEKLEEIKDQLDTAIHNFLQEKITLEQYNKIEKEKSSYPGVIKMDSVQTFEDYLRASKLEETVINELVEHEKSHFVEIEKAGLKPFFRIEFARKVEGGFSMYPAVSFDLPDHMQDEEARILLRKIIGAPADLSDRDKKQLG